MRRTDIIRTNTNTAAAVADDSGAGARRRRRAVGHCRGGGGIDPLTTYTS